MSNRTSSLYQKVFAALLVIAGIAMLLHNTEIVDLGPISFWEFLIPTAVILYGIKLVLDSLFGPGRFMELGWFWGAVLILIGSLLLLGHLEIISFNLGTIWRLWPVFIVYIGLSLLLSKNRYHGRWAYHKTSYHNDDDINENFTAGPLQVQVEKIKRREANWSAEPIDLHGGIGEYEFDFTQAFIPEENIPVKLNGWIGDIKIMVPRDVDFSVKAHAFVGDLYAAGHSRDGFSPELYYKTPGYDEAVRKLTFEIHYRILDLRIDHV